MPSDGWDQFNEVENWNRGIQRCNEEIKAIAYAQMLPSVKAADNSTYKRRGNLSLGEIK